MKFIRVNLRVCENGHAEPIPGTEREVEMVLARCGHWVEHDDKFCTTCGSALRHEYGE